MALTKEDIDIAIAQAENQDVIRYSLSNYFEGLDEPVSVAIGIGKSQWDRDMHPENVDKVVDLLRSKGIDAVSFLDPQAARPDKFVVNESGVLFPFMSPQDSLKAVILVEDTVINTGHQIVGHINPQSKENILYTANSSIKIKNDAVGMEQGINLEISHPDKELFKEIEQRNGGDYKSFIDRKINEAYASSKIVDFNTMDIENVYANGMAELYRGGTLGANPYATVSQWNSRKVAHSSPAISVCASFSGKETTMSSRGGAVYEKTESGLYYGFIYKFESMGDKQKYYHNVGLETGDDAKTKDEVNLSLDNPWNGWSGEIYESPVLPHHNKLKEMYIYVGKRGENDAKLYSVPLDENGNITDQEWQDFMKLHEPTDDKVVGYLKDRQDAQKREQTENAQHTYDFELKQGLEADNQHYLENISAKNFLRNFIHDSEIQEKDGKLYIDAVSDGTPLHMEGLKLNHLPDLSNVKINGHWGINSYTVPEIDATKLPECTMGITLIDVDVKNTGAVSADRFLGIIGAGKTKEGFIECETTTHSSLSCDGMPQGWEKLKFMQLPSFVDLVYDTIDKVPETLQGIGQSGITIKDQTSIENIPVADFIYKIQGNLGTHPLNFQASVLYSEGIRHTEIHDNIELNLQYTNIGTFPKDMKDLTLKRIILNHQTVVTSLDNFPITKDGVFDLNFNGDLRNETMESFLLKTKGTEWVKNNTSKGEDGHLIINGDLNFKTAAWGASDRPQMNITSLPKDVDKVEINGNVEPSELRYRFNKYLKVLKDIDGDTLSLSDINFKIDLSKHQANNISISGKTLDVILPSNIEAIGISNSENFQVSALKNVPQNLNLSFSKVQNEMPIDMTNMSINRLSFHEVQAAEINIPQECKEIHFQETKLYKPINLPSGIKIFEAQSTNFPEGSVLNLSECKSVSLINCSLPKNTTLDLSKCERVNLSDVDLSQANVILPQSGRIHINKNVKFAPDYKLDLSKCEVGFVHHSVECAEVKLPQKILTDRVEFYKIPKQTKEITTSCIIDSHCRFNFSPDVKIIDTPNKYGKKNSLKALKVRGLSKEQISTLRKERIKNVFRDVVTKIIPLKKKYGTFVVKASRKEKQNPKNTLNSDDRVKIVGLSGRTRTKSSHTVQSEEQIIEMQSNVQVQAKTAQTKLETVQTTAVSQLQTATSSQTVPLSTESSQKVADMSKKEKSNFFHNLRMGVNIILAKAENGLTTVQSSVKTQTNTQTATPQQSSILQMKMAKEKGNKI